MFIEIEKKSYDLKCLKRNLTIQSCPLSLLWDFMDADTLLNKDGAGNYIVSPRDGSAVFMDFFFDTYSQTIDIHFTPNVSHSLKINLLNFWIKGDFVKAKNINSLNEVGQSSRIA